jgi:D-psicose/D-tagatose/L-ribulose 3-epimerase
VASEDAAAHEEGKKLLSRAVEVAAELQAEALCGVLYSRLAKYPGPLSGRARDHVVAGMQHLAARADEAGVAVNLEVVNRYETNVVNTAADMLRLIDDTGASNLKVHLDTYHMNIEEDGFRIPLEQVGDRLGYVHIGESHRGYLGSGTVDFDTFFAALRDSGYRGPVTFESFSSAVVHPDLSNDLAVWRNLWSDGDDLASHAKEFMASRLGS